MPGMIGPGRQSKADLANDLGPHMKGFDGIAPFLIIEAGP